MNNKQKVISKLKGKHKVLCPKCKNDIFIKRVMEKCAVWTDEGYTEDDYIEYVDTDEYRCEVCKYKMKEKDFV